MLPNTNDHSRASTVSAAPAYVGKRIFSRYSTLISSVEMMMRRVEMLSQISGVD
jgi:hypothetical protein